MSVDVSAEVKKFKDLGLRDENRELHLMMVLM
jgi:hypothetical protein